jgi:hypothetical protein
MNTALPIKGGFFKGNGYFVHIATERFPLGLFEEHRAKQFRSLSIKHRLIINPSVAKIQL